MKLNNIFEIYNNTLKENLINENLILEDIEGKNINRAEKFIKQNYSEFINQDIELPNGETKTMSARDWTIQIRNDVPSSRLPKLANGKDSCKFLLGVTRIYFSFTKSNQNEIQGKISQLEKIIKLIANGHPDEYDNNLNNLSYSELDEKFSSTVKKNLDNEINNLKNKKFKRDESYKIIPIPDFETAQKYAKYTEWCIIHQKNMYDSYTKDGIGLFYFCLKDGFEKIKKEIGNGVPLDEYGKSMFAISVNEDGSLNTCTCRWNHDNGGNDHILKDAQEVSEFFRVNFFETFKPRSTDEILNKFKNKAIPSEIADKLNGIETKNELILVDDGRVKKYKKCYDEDDIKCFAYDKFYWFDALTGEAIDPPKKINEDFSCSDCTSLTSLEGAPTEVNGDFDCSYCTALTSLNGAPKKVKGDFYCDYCTSLTSLKGAPSKVDGDFYCSGCTSLTSLEGAPTEVNGDFDCKNCTSLTSLKGAPKKVHEYFNCSGCTSLTSLKGAPIEVGGNFYCYDCTSLTSLDGAPKEVKGDFYCDYCTSLTSLEGAPLKISGDFNCSGCTSLTSLDGTPEKVNGSFYCSHCTSLTSLIGAPAEIGGDFYCDYNSSLVSLDGAPRKIRKDFYCSTTSKITSNTITAYEKWLKTNPTENYHTISINESYVKYITSNFTRLF